MMSSNNTDINMEENDEESSQSNQKIDYSLILRLYKLDLDLCKSKANRNCSNNPRCLKGLGQSTWLINQEEDEDDDDDQNLMSEQQFCYRGLKNLGATCYLNTFLQLWFHNVTLRHAIYKWRPNISSDKILGNPITCLQLVLSMMQFSVRRFVDPSPFIKCLQLDESQEQDTHEFSSLFYSYIQNKLSYESDKSIQNTIDQQYCMKIAYIIRCSNCNMVSERESDFQELLLRVKGFKDINECIADYLKEESMEGTNKYACQQCNSLQDAKSFIQLRKLPPILHLQLLRFESSNGISRKISSYLRFPKKLDMSKFVKQAPNGMNENHIYNLFAVLIHEGQTAYSGHYITLIKKDSNWFKFNDENVEKLKDFNLKIDSDDDFQERKSNNEKGYHKSKNAYMLVYKHISEPDYELPNSYSECGLPKYLSDYIDKDNQTYLQEQEDLLHQRSLQKLDELNHQRQLRQIFCKIEVPPCEKEFDAINKSWLLDLFRADISNDVPKVNNEELLCSHKKLDIDSQFKCITTESADLIYSLYDFDTRLKLPDSFCQECTSYRINMNKLKQEIDSDSKEISCLLKYKNSQDEALFWVGKESFKKWKNIKLDSFRKQFSDFSDSEPNFDFNEDLLCQHRNLCSDPSKRRLVRRDVWLKYRKYFPKSPEFLEDSPPCSSCVEIDKTKQLIRDQNMAAAMIQRSSLNNLYNQAPCRYWSDLSIGQVYHFISTKFYYAWKKFITHPNTSNSPASLTQYECDLICNSHSLFLFPPYNDEYVGYEKSYLILDEKEWESLVSHYDYAIKIAFYNYDQGFALSPEFCQDCFSIFVQEQKQKRFKYDKVKIFVQKIVFDETDPSDENENVPKKIKHNGNNFEAIPNITKRSLRKRRLNNEFVINVSSNDKLKDIKFQIMEHFNIATYDQVLTYNDKLLSSQHNNHTLSELEIEPNSTLILTVDNRMDENASCGGDCPMDSIPGSEAGFKGTQLQLL